MYWKTKKEHHLKFDLRIFSVYIHGPRMQRNFTGSKISTLNGSRYTKSSPQFVFSRPIDRKIKMTAQPLIGRDIFVHLSRRHKRLLLGYISVRQILMFDIYEFSETACTQNPLTASYFSGQSLSACVSIWNRKASTQNPIPSLCFSSQLLSAWITIQS